MDPNITAHLTFDLHFTSTFLSSWPQNALLLNFCTYAKYHTVHIKVDTGQRVSCLGERKECFFLFLKHVLSFFLQCFLFFCKIIGYTANHLCPFHLIQIFAVIFWFLWAHRCELRLNKISQHHKIIITTRCFPHELLESEKQQPLHLHSPGGH